MSDRQKWLAGLGLLAALAAGAGMRHLLRGTPAGSGPAVTSRPGGRLDRLAGMLSLLRLRSATDDSIQRAIAAPAAEAAPAARDRDQQLAEVRASGADDDDLSRSTQAIGRAWAALAAEPQVAADFGPWECHPGGCFATVVHRSGASVERLTSEILASREAAAWPGPKMRSAPIARADGTTEVTWLLLPGPAEQPEQEQPEQEE
jgi:hypothetical protein